MDPRIAWCPPEQVESAAHEQWSRLWDLQLGVSQLNNGFVNMNGSREQEYIPLDVDNQWENKTDKYPNNKQQHYQNQHFLNRKRENKASTFGLNHSSCVQRLRNRGMTPWQAHDKVYASPGVIGCVSMVWIMPCGFFSFSCLLLGFKSVIAIMCIAPSLVSVIKTVIE